MSITHNGKQYYDEGEIILLRRESDKDLKETLTWITKDLQDNAKAFVSVRSGLDQIQKIIEKHTEVLFGNGKEGAVTQIAKITQVLDVLMSQINHEKNGLNAIGIEILKIKERSQAWNETSKDMSMVKTKIITVTVIVSIVMTLLYPKLAEAISKLF